MKGLLSDRPEVEKSWNVPNDTNYHTEDEKSSDHYVRDLVESVSGHFCDIGYVGAVSHDFRVN